MTSSSTHFTVTAIFLATFAMAGTAQAQVAINQASATAGSVTPGDTPGFPITLSAPGSYKLTGNLVVTNPLQGAIYITAPNVTLDLNGFTISGPTVCGMPSAKVITCNYGYSTGAPGIDHSGEGSRTLIRNGTVRGFGGGGVWVSEGAQVEDLRVEHNGYLGLTMTGAGRIRNVQAYYNQMHGILAYDSVIEGSISRFNGGSGYYLMNTLLIGSKADINKSFGVMITGSSGASGVRESMMNGNLNGSLYASPSLKSMGNNLCDGSAC